MAELLLSLSWKDHSNNLATLCKSSLNENFLVDCTLAAEGQSLKAHRLILSACSPYFRTLFSEEREKHPIVILKDTLFGTLKAVVDYMYHGETQIAEGHLEAFLALADSLQIKGLNNSPAKVCIKNLPHNADGNAPQIVLEDNLNTSDVHGSSASEKDSPRNSHSSIHPGGYADALQSNPSSLLEESSDPCEKVRLLSMMAPQEKQQIPFACDEGSSDTEINVKHEPLCSSILEPRVDPLGGVGNEEPVSGNFASETNEGTAIVFGEQDLKQSNSRYEHSSRGRIESALVVIPHQLQQQRAALHEGSSGANCAEQTESLHPVILLPKRELINDAEKEYSVQDMSQNDAIAMDRETEPGKGGQINQCASAAWGRGRCRASGQRAQGRVRHHAVARPVRCALCPAVFNSHSALHYHKRTHTGERPYSCDVCGVAFITSTHLSQHKRRHTGERPYSCDECGDAFAQLSALQYHTRKHTGERLHRCDVCGAAFIISTHLIAHMRNHTGERPFKCETCGVAFKEKFVLKKHMRVHTRERPFSSIGPATSPGVSAPTQASGHKPSTHSDALLQS